jgi:hypothetical protein
MARRPKETTRKTPPKTGGARTPAPPKRPIAVPTEVSRPVSKTPPKTGGARPSRPAVELPTEVSRPVLKKRAEYEQEVKRRNELKARNTPGKPAPSAPPRPKELTVNMQPINNGGIRQAITRPQSTPKTPVAAQLFKYKNNNSHNNLKLWLWLLMLI